MVNIVIFGPPGSGKGTQSRKIIEKYGYSHISTGDLLRHEIASGSELGKQVKKIIDKGELVSDELIIDILNKELDRLGDVPGIIFDGFPRTLSQASELKKMLLNRGTKISVLLFLDVPHEELIKRLLKRQSLDGRSDDTMEVIENRLRIYEEQTAPTIDFYRKQGKLRTIDGTGTIDEIFNRIDEVLKELN